MIKTFLLVALLVVLLVPLALLLSMRQEAVDTNDAEHMIKPMLELLAQSPMEKANTPVEPLLELEDAWAIEDARKEAGGGYLSCLRYAQWRQ